MRFRSVFGVQDRRLGADAHQAVSGAHQHFGLSWAPDLKRLEAHLALGRENDPGSAARDHPWGSPPALHQSVAETSRKKRSRAASSCPNIVARTFLATASAGPPKCL